jgi:YidC/Oxa1 family membrane protein insertase
MNRYIIIALYALSFTLLFQYFFTNKQTEVKNTNDIILTIVDDTIVVPNSPNIEIVNHTQSGATFNTCSDITLSVDSRTIGSLGEWAPSFCQEIIVWAWEKKHIPMEELSTLLTKMPGKYILTLKTSNGDRTMVFDLSLPGTFRSLLTTVFYNPIYNLFVALLTFIPGHPLGWAIVIITIIIRLILLVPQQHMLESQKKLQLIQPKIKALQEKFGWGSTPEEKRDNQAKLGMEMLDLYKKEWVSPMGSCLPLLIQMPILIGLYWVVSSITDPSNFYHLYSFFKDFDPTAINTNFIGLDLKQIGGVVGGIFALVLAGLQYIQAKLSFAYNPVAKKEEKKVEKKEGEIPEFALDPQMMQKSMLYVFPVMIGVTALFFPLGVGLYWFIGTLFVIAQQWYVNKKKIK